MEKPEPAPGNEAFELVAQLREGSELLWEPAGSQNIKSAVRARLETMEVRRQENLGAIARGAYLRIAKRPIVEDRDWLADFVESAKDTGNPVIQELWSKLLAGEMEAPGSCSKRTLRMVRSLSQAEALLVKQVCRTVCFLEQSSGDKIAYVNVVVQRRQSDFSNTQVQHTTLFEDESDVSRKNHRKLISCGFLANDDFDFSFDGEGHLAPEKFRLSDGSPRRIIMGAKALVANPLQPGLLQEMPELAERNARKPQMITPSASIDFYTWKLTAEGDELFQVLAEPPDYGVLERLGAACRRGGLTVTEAKA